MDPKDLDFLTIFFKDPKDMDFLQFPKETGIFLNIFFFQRSKGNRIFFFNIVFKNQQKR